MSITTQLLALLRWNLIRGKPSLEPALGNPATTGFVLSSTDAGVRSWVAQSSGTVDRSINQFRLTLESGVPVSTTDQTAKTMVYACPAAGSATEEAQISLLGTDDTTWATHSTPQLSIGTTTTRNGTTTNGNKVISGLATTVDLVVGQEITGTGVGAGSVIASIDSDTQVTGTVNSTASATVAVTFKCPAGKNYDLLCANIGGTPTLAHGPAWTSDSVRATDLAVVDGVKCLSGTYKGLAEGRWRRVGGVGITATAGQTQFVYGDGSTSPSFLIESEDNRVMVPFVVRPGYTNDNVATTHTVTSTTFTECNGGVGSRVTFFGSNVIIVPLVLAVSAYSSNAGGYVFGGIGEDATTTAKSMCFMKGTTPLNITCGYACPRKTGRHYFAIEEMRVSYDGTMYNDFDRYGGSVDPYATVLTGGLFI